MKIIFTLLLIPMLSFNSLAENKATNTNNTVVVVSTNDRAEAKLLTARLKEIRDLAKRDNLSDDEKLKLRTEVLSIRERIEKLDGVSLYLSFTAILIIILLIVLL